MKNTANFILDKIHIEFNKKNKESNKYVKLFKVIKKLILNNEISHEWVLPTTRQLAQSLNISRTTVLKSYDLLLLENLLVTKIGSGTLVNYNLEKKNVKKLYTNVKKNVKYPNISKIGESYLKNFHLINRNSQENLAFRPGLPPIDVFPINQWKKLLDYYWQHVKASGLSYSQASGMFELKNSICKYLKISRNISCDEEQIIIVSGTLQSLFLISNTILDINDTVVVENPVFPNVHSIFKSSQANIIPVTIDNEGIDLKILEEIKFQSPKLIHVSPSNQYPLGIKMSLKRRKKLLEWASRNGSFIIENDYENEIANIYQPTPTIFSLDKEDRTIYAGTFNRLLHPSVRLGYMIVPKYLVPVVEAFQEHSHRFISQSTQVIMNLFIEKNYLFQHIKNCLQITRERHDFFKNEFTLHIKTMYIQEKPFSSFHLIAFFKEEKTVEEELEIIKKLSLKNITVFSLSKCYIGDEKKTGLIFGFSSVRNNMIKQTIISMSEII